MIIPRAIEDRYNETVSSRRVTVVTGPRQAGKTTLIRSGLPLTGGLIRSLDEQAVLEAALADPAEFVALGERPLVIDEVQRAGEPLVLAIKAAVDKDPTPGQFILTGSSNFLTVPTISESLAGRAGLVEVWPFTQGELANAVDRFVDLLLDRPSSLAGLQPTPLDRPQLLRRVCIGGYPEVQRLTVKQRDGWFRDYVSMTISRDIVELSGIRKVTELRELLRLIAARSGGELVMEHLIRDSTLQRQAVYDHRSWLETIHLVALLPAWSRNLTARAKRRPKVFLTDPGLTAWLLGKTPEALEDPADPSTGRLVETFVFNELRRQLTWSQTEAAIFHWQDRAGAEIDFVLEASDGRLAAVEVKTGRTPRPGWFRQLAHMRDFVGERFTAGVVLYGGTEILPFGERLLAMPISSLWSG